MIDTLIIGGGVAGLGAAAHLSPSHQVVVLEREEVLGYHASGRSAAMFEQDYGPPAIKALSRASRAFFEAPGEGRETYLSPRGLMLVARADHAQHLMQILRNSIFRKFPSTTRWHGCRS
ncbi:MAG: hypothetical protein EpisKO_16990 [Epibacterium sp.]